MLRALPILMLAGLLLDGGPVSARVIYGEDNRLEVMEAPLKFQQLARSVVTMVPRTNLQVTPQGINLKQTTLREWLSSQFETEEVQPLFSRQGIKFCEQERFIDQPNPGQCSGFLIAPDLIVTAGHCTMAPDFCQENLWVFDFKLDKSRRAGLQMDPDNIYRCKQVITSALDMNLALDHAIVQLERVVVNREPLDIRTTSKIEDHAPLTVIGSPSGLPLKVAGGARVRDNSHLTYFSANLDTFQGNSGSPVFNSLTGVVEGILVRGEEDFVPNMELMCLEANRCEDNACRGEDASRLSAIPELALRDTLLDAAESAELDVIQKILGLGVWIDIYGKDRQSALLKASIQGHHSVMQMLAENGASISLQDLTGKTPLHYTAQRADLAGIELLLNFKAEMDMLDQQGESPLFGAIRARSLEAIQLLLAAGARINITNNFGMNPAQLARSLKFPQAQRLLVAPGKQL
jgi:hypothetical protein